MYHPSRGGVRGGRDQFNWDDVKVDKHRENYLGHSVKAPVGRWQRGKDLHWYTKKSGLVDDAEREEIARIKAEEEQAMREALGLAPVRDNRHQGNRLDKHDIEELLKRGKTAEELSETYTAAERTQGVGFGPITATKKVNGYEKGGELAGLDPVDQPVRSTTAEPRSGTDVKLTKEEKREAKERRKLERKAAKLARKEERRRRREHSDDVKDREEKQRRASDDEDDSPSRKRRRRRHDSDSE